MGIVIINGKRYSSVTGLQIDDLPQKNLIKRKQVVSTYENKVVEPTLSSSSNKTESLNDDDLIKINQTMDSFLRTKVEKVNVSPINKANKVQPKKVKITVNDSETKRDLPSWVTNYIEGGEPTEVEPETDAERVFRLTARRASNPSGRRHVKSSKTLNRRFVTKPHANHIAKVAKTKIEARSNSFDASAKLVSSTKVVDGFRPLLTKKQASAYRAYKNRISVASDVNLKDTKAQSSLDIADKIADPKDTPSDNDRFSILQEVLKNEQSSASAGPGSSSKIAKSTKLTANAKKKRINSKERKSTKKPFRAPAIAAFALSLMLVVGYGVYLAMPSISVKVAANNAGIDAKNPYALEGYHINGPIAYSSGEVTINYVGNNGSKYSVKQSRSNLDENTVRGNAEAISNGNYQSIKGRDSNIYRYYNNATWVKGDMIYTISGNRSLDDNQILTIANSL